MKLYGKDLISTQDWEKKELLAVLNLAAQMKRDPFSGVWSNALLNKSFLMIFYNPSLRTHISFETAATQLGGHAQYRSVNMSWEKTSKQAGDSIHDIAKVVSRYVDGIGIRITLDAISHYGAGYEILRQYANWADIPVISMADDRFHPCQALADLLGWAEVYSAGLAKPDIDQLKGKKLLLTWARSGLARPRSAVQSHLLLASRFGMDINLAYPKGYDLDPEVCDMVRENCRENGSNFEIIHDPDNGYEEAHVVYVRNWVSPEAYCDGQFQKQSEITKAYKYEEWITTQERMSRTENAIFANPMPLDRGNEVTDEVADGTRSVVFDVAENRLHVQKAIMALVMSDLGTNAIL